VFDKKLDNVMVRNEVDFLTAYRVFLNSSFLGSYVESPKRIEFDEEEDK
jgi:hypothetical protein